MSDEDKTIVHNLRKEVTVHGEKVKSLSFREPNAQDIQEAGLPVVLDFSKDPIGVSFDEKKMGRMMTRLCGGTPSTIEMLDPKDWVSIAWKLADFFMPGADTAETQS